VPKYDAFGREIGEDTLAGLEGGAVELPSSPDEGPAHTHPEQAVVAPGGTIGAPAAGVAGAVRRFGPRRLIRIAIFGVVAYWIVQGGQAVLEGTRDARESLRKAFPTATAPGTPGIADAGEAPERPAKPPAGLEPGSLVRRRELAAAVARLRRDHGGGRLMHLRVAPERVDAQVVAKHKLHVLQVPAGGELREIATSWAPRGTPTMPWEAIRPAGAERLARTAARRLDVPLRRLDYALASEFTDGQRWIVYFKNGRYAIGDGDGRFERAF